jgi:hypothetical protein
MTDPSPAAQAIVNAAVEAGGGYGRATPTLHARLAAALRAAADQVVPEMKPWHRTSDASAAKHDVRQQLLAIAAELEGLGPVSEKV